MNKQHPTNGIGWTDYTWNPVKGLCPVGCWYCYARKMQKRFHPTIGFEYSMTELGKPLELKKPSKIFVESVFELFHPVVTGGVRDAIFRIIKQCPQHTFQILTKMPENIDRPMPDNVWLGVSITNDDKIYALYQDLLDAEARVKFISFEPLFLNLHYLPVRIDWAIIGRLTGHGHKYDPSLAKLEYMVKAYKKEKVPVFLKNNLVPIMGEEYIKKHQEFPEGGKR